SPAEPEWASPRATAKSPADPERAMDGASGDGTRSLYRYPLTDRRGRRIVVNITLSPLAAADGEGEGNVITFDEVTDQVRMEERLQRQDRLASIGLLAAGVAHE